MWPFSPVKEPVATDYNQFLDNWLWLTLAINWTAHNQLHAVQLSCSQWGNAVQPVAVAVVLNLGQKLDPTGLRRSNPNQSDDRVTKRISHRSKNGTERMPQMWKLMLLMPVKWSLRGLWWCLMRASPKLWNLVDRKVDRWVCWRLERLVLNVPGIAQDDDHDCNIGSQLKMKGETMKDLDLMFLKRIPVNFNSGNKVEKLKGCWCLVCK